VILLDTHAWLWWSSADASLSPAAWRAIDEARGRSAIHVSSISAWEVAQLVARGRLRLSMDAADWISKAEELPYVRFVPVDNRIAVRATQLPPGVGADPADRMIVATADVLGLTLVTRDRRLRASDSVATIW